MSTAYSRRSWIRRSALTAAGLGLVGLDKLTAHAAGQRVYEILPDWRWENQLPADIDVRLLANENPYGPGPMARQAIVRSARLGNRYGFESARELTKAIAEKEGVPVDHIQLGAGSNSLLELTAITTFNGGGRLVSAEPAYMSLIRTALEYTEDWKQIRLREDGSHDLSGMEAAMNGDTRMVYVCNPNNPTGTITEPGELMAFCKSAAERSVVFVDEAYLDFLDDPEANSMVPLVKEGKDVIVARTFSKLHGMAGMRVGYLIGKPALLDPIRDLVRADMCLSAVSIEAARASMNDLQFLERSKEMNANNREFTFNALVKAGLNPTPSHTSFMVFPIDRPGETWLDQMREEGVGVRAFRFYDQDHCRVSIGTRPEMERFIAATKTVMAKK